MKTQWHHLSFHSMLEKLSFVCQKVSLADGFKKKKRLSPGGLDPSAF